MNDKQFDLMDIGVLDPECIEFYKTSGGFIGMRKAGEDMGRVLLARIMPQSMPMMYISVMGKPEGEEEDDELKEFGILRDVNELPAAQIELIREELERRYYSPTIVSIDGAKEKMGYLYFDVQLTEGARTFAVRDVSRNVRLVDEKRVMIHDVDGNRYVIRDIAKLDSKSMTRLSPYMF